MNSEVHSVSPHARRQTQELKPIQLSKKFSARERAEIINVVPSSDMYEQIESLEDLEPLEEENHIFEQEFSPFKQIHQ